MKIWRIALALALGLTLAVIIQADEGMWMPHQMKGLNLRALGLQMDPEDLFKKNGTGLMSAVVNLGGGTGEFVSAEGLILTNHHVAFGAIQRASSKEKDYIENGFLSRSRSEEIPAPGVTADVLLSYEDVTDKIVSRIKPGLTYGEIYDVIERAEKEIIAEAEKAGKDIRSTIARMYSGNRYYLFNFKRIKDLRLVCAPPQDLGNFGGEVDNWMWPRHTCDFSFMRAYVSKQGLGADYNPDNIPYQPKSYLRISLEGVKEKDFTFVVGYPGRTYRNYTLSEVNFEREVLARRMDLYKEIITFFENATGGNRELEIRYASKLRGLYNSLKNYQAKIEGMDKIDLFGKKEAYEKSFLEWLNQVPEGQKIYANVLARIADFMEKYAGHYWKNNSLSGLVEGASAPALLSQAYLISRTVEERQKTDSEREPSYQDRNLPDIKQRIETAERGYELPTDRAFFKYQLKKLLSLSDSQVPAALRELVAKKSEKAIDAYADDLYNKTVLLKTEKRLELINLQLKELVSLQDPMINLAAELEKELKVLREEGKALNQERLELRKIYEEALLQRSEGKLAPDANSTIRFTCGRIEGYYPRDAVFYSPLTTLKGVIEKNTGKFPFRLPEKLKKLYQEKDFGRYLDGPLKDVVCCFLNTTNVTGGNSGSPALNARGEQVGIVFDMTYESVVGDYQIIPELQRTINVDIRYVLFITDKFSGAGQIIKELGL